MKTILMSKENPKGAKLEELLIQIANELTVKNEKIIADTSSLSFYIQNNNLTITKLLKSAFNIQMDTMKKLDEKSPDEGVTGTPRIGDSDE